MDAIQYFEHPIEVVEGDIDLMGHVNNVVHLRYVQDAAAARWWAVTSSEGREGVAWVVRRHEIEYLRPATLGDRPIARTWVGSIHGPRFGRFTEVRRTRDGRAMTSTRSEWVAIDPHSRRPLRATEGIRRLFEASLRGQAGVTHGPDLDRMRPLGVGGSS